MVQAGSSLAGSRKQATFRCQSLYVQAVLGTLVSSLSHYDQVSITPTKVMTFTHRNLMLTTNAQKDRARNDLNDGADFETLIVAQ